MRLAVKGTSKQPAIISINLYPSNEKSDYEKYGTDILRTGHYPFTKKWNPTIIMGTDNGSRINHPST